MHIKILTHDAYRHIPCEVLFKGYDDIKELLMISVPFLAMNPYHECEPQKFTLNSKNLSSCHFPVVTKAIPTGSRVERLFTEASDIDYLIECGPICVTPRRQTRAKCVGPRLSSTRLYYKKMPSANSRYLGSTSSNFYCEATCHPGFYKVFDKQGQNIHPGVLQIQLAPYLMKLSGSTSILKEIKKQESGKAALPNCLSGENEDNVIALRLSCWPAVIKKELKKQLNEEILQALYSMYYHFFYMKHKKHVTVESYSLRLKITRIVPVHKIIDITKNLVLTFQGVKL